MSDIKIREIVEEDIEKEFLKSLDSLRKASDLDKEVAKDILKKNNFKPRSHYSRGRR